MKKEAAIQSVTAACEPVIESAGMELIHVEFQREPQGLVLRLYIDRPGGVTIDDCTYASRNLGDILDAVTAIEGAYQLEVSSPGLFRPVSRKQDFVKFDGHAIKIRTTHPITGRKNFTGVLSGLTDETVHLALDTGEMVSIPHALIAKAHLTGET